MKFERDSCDDEGDDHEAHEHRHKGDGDCDNRKSRSSAADSPAIVLNSYGAGKTVFYAFELAASLDNNHGDPLSDMLKASLAYIHNSWDEEGSGKRYLIPVELKFRSLGNEFDIETAETYPDKVALLDPDSFRWVKDNPWQNRLKVGPLETGLLRFHALMPDKSGTYPLITEVKISGAPNLQSNLTLTTDLVAERDLKGLASAILKELNGLPGRKSSKLSKTIKYMSYVEKRTIRTRKDIDQNISDILSAVNCLLQLDIDTTGIRLMIDDLLRGWESRYYLGD